MRKARVIVHDIFAGILEEASPEGPWRFIYETDYKGDSVSLTMPANQSIYEFTVFPSFFEGLLPEGMQLEALLRLKKLDRNDLFGQLVAVGRDMVGAVTVTEDG